MHVNKWLLGTAGVLAIIATVAVTWLHAATPTVGAAAANPAYVVVSTPTAVVITTTITDSTLLANGVNLLQTDASGKTLSTIGLMHDDGVNGDLKAGDKVFSYQVTANQAAVGQLYYRASAAFKGFLQRVLSNVASVTVDPFKLPPDPGAAGKQTLAGIDSDHDGVRDDIQRYIALTYLDSPKVQRALSQYASAEQVQLTSSDTSTAGASVAVVGSIDCLAYISGVDASRKQLADVTARMLDTKDRSIRYESIQQSLSGSFFALTPLDQQKSQCTVDPDR